jgi:hypothetical protein
MLLLYFGKPQRRMEACFQFLRVIPTGMGGGRGLIPVSEAVPGAPTCLSFHYEADHQSEDDAGIQNDHPRDMLEALIQGRENSFPSPRPELSESCCCTQAWTPKETVPSTLTAVAEEVIKNRQSM